MVLAVDVVMIAEGMGYATRVSVMGGLLLLSIVGHRFVLPDRRSSVSPAA
jgi:hypothetical protein